MCRAALKGKKGVRNTSRNERSRGCSLLHGHGTFSTSLISLPPNLDSGLPLYHSPCDSLFPTFYELVSTIPLC